MSPRRRAPDAQPPKDKTPATPEYAFGPGRLGLFAQAVIDLGQGAPDDAEAALALFSLEDCSAANQVLFRLTRMLEKRFVAVYGQQIADADADDAEAGG